MNEEEKQRLVAAIVGVVRPKLEAFFEDQRRILAFAEVGKPTNDLDRVLTQRDLMKFLHRGGVGKSNGSDDFL